MARRGSARRGSPPSCASGRPWRAPGHAGAAGSTSAVTRRSACGAGVAGELLPSLPAPPPEAGVADELAVLIVELARDFGRAPRADVGGRPDLQRTRLSRRSCRAARLRCARGRPAARARRPHRADAPEPRAIAYAARRLQGLRVTLLLTPHAAGDACGRRARTVAARGRGRLPRARAGAARRASPSRRWRARPTAAGRSAGGADRRTSEGNALLGGRVGSALSPGGGDQLAPSLRANAALRSRRWKATCALLETAAVAARPLRPRRSRRCRSRTRSWRRPAALDTGLVFAAAGAIGFRHALVRDAIYEEIAEPRRRGLHQRWARTLIAAGGASPRHAEVARQLRLAGADLEAAPHLIAAAADARAVAALEQACAYLEEALSISPEDPAHGSSSGRSRRGGSGARRPRPPSPGGSNCLRAPIS